MRAEATLELNDGRVSAVVRPTLGAGIARFDFIARGKREPLFRPEPAQGAQHPFELALQVLVPWSNRVSGEGFSFRGKRYHLEPNLIGEPHPIHGNGFSMPWDVIEHGPESAVLRLDSVGPGPFRYAATLSYGVADGVLSMSLLVENTGDQALPFGFGFHPWMIRTPNTQLRASASRVWLEDEQHLRKGTAPVVIPHDWDFQSLASLPDGWINNAFTGWDGTGEVWWPDRELRLYFTASAVLSTYLVYSPSRSADFFCFEPVSHPVDAFNLPGEPTSHGLVILEVGERTHASATWTADRPGDSH